MMPASSPPSLPPIHPGDGSVSAGGHPPAPHAEWALTCVPPAPRAPPAPPGPLVPQTRTPRLHILGPTGFLIRKPRQLAAQIGSPHLFWFLCSERLGLGQPDIVRGERLFSSGPPCRPWAPSRSLACQLPSGTPPGPGNRPHGHQPPPSPPGCRASEAVDPVPLRCPHVHPPQGPRGMPQVRTRGSACRFQSPLNL